MKVINIEDFSGGKNSFDLQSMIADNECASGTINVWAPLKVLTKVPGYSTLYSNWGTASANGISVSGIGSIYADATINASFNFYLRGSVTGAGGTFYYPWNDSMAPALNSLLGYSTGTVSISGASLISATGSGTTWTIHASANDLFRVAVPYQYSQVASVEDNTHLTLRTAISGAIATGSVYSIGPAQTYQEAAWASLNGSWWSTTTADQMQQYDNRGMLRIPSAPKAAFLAAHKNYLFAARTNTADSRLYWSAIKDPTSWSANDFIDIDKNNNGKISGLISYGNELIIFKNYGMYKLVGDTFSSANPTYAVYPISVPKYFLYSCNFGAVVHQGLLYLYSNGQLFTYKMGTFFIQRISNKYQADLPSFLGTHTDAYATTTMAEQDVQLVSFFDYLIIKGINYISDSRAYAGILDHKGAWWQILGAEDANQAASSPLAFVPFVILPANTASKSRLLLTSNLSPITLVWDFLGFPNYDSNFYKPVAGATAAISATWVSKEFSIEYGTFKHIVVYLDKQTAGNLTFAWSIDQAAYVNNTIDMTLGRGQVIRSTLNVNQKGSTIQLKITQSAAGQTFRIYGIKIFYEPYTENRQL